MQSHFKIGRFAPSTTGRVHPGTLIAALLCWLDARSKCASVVLRLEDLDRERTKSGYVDQMERDLEWFGFDWDSRSLQSQNAERYEAALEKLVGDERVYACDCSRAQIREVAGRAPDGSHRYPGTCRSKTVTLTQWREVDRPLRLRLDSREIALRDESGADLSGDASKLFGDPVLRRRDGAYSYHFASVLDDSQSGVDRVVRGRDLASSTVLQVALQQEFMLQTPSYRHHCLFLERAGGKLSKLHGAIDAEALREEYDASELCGRLASFVGLVPSGTACRPIDLAPEFDWNRVRSEDLEIRWEAGVGLQRRPG
jgi:glutamyl-tRNA synthetase/glutamyl-Q tRNA(Asp) synthetase